MDWSEIAFIVAIAALISISTYVKHLRKLITEAQELVATIRDALADKKITAGELENIFKEANDVAQVALEIIKLISRR